MTNEKIRIAMIKRSIKQYEVANRLGLTETAFSKLLSKELPKDKQTEILNVINSKREDT